MKKVGLFIICFFVSLQVNAQTTTQKVEFNRCVDGDTAVFNVDGIETKYRFLAIDTPESVAPNKAVEEFGKDASEYTCNKLTNAKEIIIEYENSNKTDKYGRYLGWIWVDGSLLQKELISVGYAKVAYIYGKYRYTESLCLIQSLAKKEKYGLWGNDTEEGYCSTINLEGIEDIIDYSKISVSDNNETSSKSDQKAYDALEKFEKIQDKVDKYVSKNEDKLQNGGFVIVIVIGIIYLIIKEFKK
jgi:micrococcal nuclease